MLKSVPTCFIFTYEVFKKVLIREVFQKSNSPSREQREAYTNQFKLIKWRVTIKFINVTRFQIMSDIFIKFQFFFSTILTSKSIQNPKIQSSLIKNTSNNKSFSSKSYNVIQNMRKTMTIIHMFFLACTINCFCWAESVLHEFI